MLSVGLRAFLEHERRCSGAGTIGLSRGQNNPNSSRNDDMSGFLLLLDEMPVPSLNHQIMSDTERGAKRRAEVERCLFALTGTPGLEIKEHRTQEEGHSRPEANECFSCQVERLIWPLSDRLLITEAKEIAAKSKPWLDL